MHLPSVWFLDQVYNRGSIFFFFFRSAKWAYLLGIHTPPVIGISQIFHRGCVEFKWNRPLSLTAHNWQKWKRVFLACRCHKIYRDEALGLKSCKYTWKITIFVKMWNLGQYRAFCQWLLNWSSYLIFFLHMCDIYDCDYLKHSTFRFNLIDFQLNTDYPSQFCVFLP